MTLRDYQREALDGLYGGWASGLDRIGVSLPTGTGKTHIMAHLGRELVCDNRLPDQSRVMYLVHRDTLIDQTIAKLRATLPPGTSIGVVKAERNQLAARVLVVSVHTLRSAARLAQLPRIGLCVVDEAHVSVSPTYMRVFEHIGALDGRCRLAGFSATWSRSDATGLGDVWQDIVYAKSIKWAIQNGHLVRPRGIRIGEGVSTEDVNISRMTGDYAEKDLERVVMLEEIRDAVVRGVQRHSAGRPGALFAPTVAAAEFFGDGLRAAGIPTAGFYGKTGKNDRRRVDGALRSGELQMVTTCTAIAEGYDNPQLTVGVLCRPTRHEGLFVQMMGRFLRPWPGKAEALMLDCVGSTEDVKLRNAIDLSVSSETTDGEDLPIDKDEDQEPVGRERKARVRKFDGEIELFAGTQVQWLTAAGVPFVQCGERLVFLVEGRDGWRVGECDKRTENGRPVNVLMVADGLGQEDALTVASDHAEVSGEHLARRSARWRLSPPSEGQLSVAAEIGMQVPEGMTRGQLSDRLSMTFAARVLAPFAVWQQRELTSA